MNIKSAKELVAAATAEVEKLSNSPTHVKPLSSGKRRVLYCASGNRSALATKTFKSIGIANVSHVAGGFPATQKGGGETESAAWVGS
ncbi:rhodanese-like domain-containing protein [Bradyrhizobium sp.]|uniref:rhodanese-like domain-containing protein n=1 Tax=Bradyrhizobium sp. TaxID=376 RepID=UPI000A4325A2|nr:rhodanese-like domain-containing protein [Bradyrhizobium sp.]